jgi:hypothetical protein
VVNVLPLSQNDTVSVTNVVDNRIERVNTTTGEKGEDGYDDDDGDAGTF